MANLFAGSEIVEFGVQIEKNGRDFYRGVKDAAKEAEVKALFDYLALEEERHIEAFEKLLKSVEQYNPPESYPGEYFAYMNALASEYVFTQKDKGAEIAKGITSASQAMAMAIDFEKDSVVFFEGMKKVVSDNDCEVIEDLIFQEQDHLMKLLHLKHMFKL